MKLIGIASIVAVLVGSSSSIELPRTLRINIHTFIDNGLNKKNLETENNPGGKYKPTAKKIVIEAEQRLNQLFGQDKDTNTTFELRFTKITDYSCGSSHNCQSSMIKKHDKVGADLYAFFKTGSTSSGHLYPEGKMCHLGKDYRTVTLPGKDRITEKPARDLVYFIGRLLGMRYDTIDRRTLCPLGNMVLDRNKQNEAKKNSVVKEEWNGCNKEDLKDFYEKQLANEPRGFCLDKDVTIPKIDISIHFFYDPLFDDMFGNDINKVQRSFNMFIKISQNILNDRNTLGATFELKKVHQDRLDSSPSGFDAMATISENRGTSAANFYVFFTNKIIAQMPEAHPDLFGKICSGDRAHRTVSLNVNGYVMSGVGAQLAYYIGRTLGMDNDGLHDDLNCRSGYMDFRGKNDKSFYVLPTDKSLKINRWELIYKYYNTKKQWNQCNADDLSSFYRQFLRSNNPGKEWRMPCVAPVHTDLRIAINTGDFSELEPGELDSTNKVCQGSFCLEN